MSRPAQPSSSSSSSSMNFSFFTALKCMAPQFVHTYLTQLGSFVAQSCILMLSGSYHGPENLAVVGTAFTITNCCAIAILFGIASALDTCSTACYGRVQAATAKKDEAAADKAKRSFMLYTMLAMAVCLIFAVPLCLFLADAGGLMSKLVDYFFASSLHERLLPLLRNMIPFVIFTCTSFVFAKATQAEHRADIPGCAAFVSCAVGVLSALVLVPAHGINPGVPISLVLIGISQQIVILVLVFGKIQFLRIDDDDDDDESSTSDSLLCRSDMWLSAAAWRDAFLEGGRLSTFLSTATATTASVWLEWLSFELIFFVIAAADKRRGAGNTLVSAWSVMFNICWLSFAMHFAEATVVATWTGRLLGESKPDQARFFAKCAFVVVFFFANLQSTILYVFHRQIFGLYGVEEEVAPAEYKAMKACLGVWYVFHLADATQYTANGLLRGAGRASWAPMAVVPANFLVGVPCAYLFAVVLDKELVGLVVGFSIGLACEIGVLAFLVVEFFDWDALSEEAVREHNAAAVPIEEEKKKNGTGADAAVAVP